MAKQLCLAQVRINIRKKRLSKLLLLQPQQSLNLNLDPIHATIYEKRTLLGPNPILLYHAKTNKLFKLFLR